ncbi:MAG: hypothetical protein ACI4P0_02860 [Mailhella sp.]
MTQKTIMESMARMKRRREVRTFRIPPPLPCVKCGSLSWEPDFYGDSSDWYCFKCGNRGFWKGREFFQTSGGR